MKFLYVTDIHGFEWKYEFILNYAIKNNIYLVINGGDCLPKTEPIHKEQKHFITKYLKAHFQKYQQAAIYHLIMPGNDDLKVFDDLFQDILDKFNYCHNLSNSKIDIMGYSFIGFNLVKDAPFMLKDRFRRDLKNSDDPKTERGTFSTELGFKTIDWQNEYYKLRSLEEELELLQQPSDFSKTIYIIHQPPKDFNLAVNYRRKDVGSIAVKNFLSKYQPILSLHGHIHENYQMTNNWLYRQQKTMMIQPGQEDDLVFIEGDLEEGNYYRRVISWQNRF